ncbi:MAG: type III pantothenate kinase [Planctomycetota bacterium]
MPDLLALDVGNSSLKYARFGSGRPQESGRLPLDADLAALPAAERIAAVSVNPAALARVREARPGLGVVGEEIPLPLPVEYHPPEDCGADRVLAVAGALHLRPEASAVLVLDAGTCLTATVGLRGRGVVGGAILPGPELMARALAEGTARLPRVDPAPVEKAIGRSTETAIRSGIQAAIHGAVRELIRRCREEGPAPLEVVAAGTGATALAAALPEIDAVHPDATLWGVLVAARDWARIDA